MKNRMYKNKYYSEKFNQWKIVVNMDELIENCIKKNWMAEKNNGKK